MNISKHKTILILKSFILILQKSTIIQLFEIHPANPSSNHTQSRPCFQQYIHYNHSFHIVTVKRGRSSPLLYPQNRTPKDKARTNFFKASFRDNKQFHHPQVYVEMLKYVLFLKDKEPFGYSFIQDCPPPSARVAYCQALTAPEAVRVADVPTWETHSRIQIYILFA